MTVIHANSHQRICFLAILAINTYAKLIKYWRYFYMYSLHFIKLQSVFCLNRKFLLLGTLLFLNFSFGRSFQSHIIFTHLLNEILYYPRFLKCKRILCDFFLQNRVTHGKAVLFSIKFSKKSLLLKLNQRKFLSSANFIVFINFFRACGE